MSMAVTGSSETDMAAGMEKPILASGRAAAVRRGDSARIGRAPRPVCLCPRSATTWPQHLVQRGGVQACREPPKRAWRAPARAAAVRRAEFRLPERHALIRSMQSEVWVRARAVILSVRRLGRHVRSYGCGRHHGQTAARVPQGPRPPPRYKTAVVTWLAIYPLVLALSSLLTRLKLGLPPALSILLVTLVTVVAATYVALPLLSWLLRRWLVPRR
jgi:hypothetical protein